MRLKYELIRRVLQAANEEPLVKHTTFEIHKGVQVTPTKGTDKTTYVLILFVWTDYDTIYSQNI